MKRCVLCGKMFVPKSNAQRICEDTHYRSCKNCGKLFEIHRPSDSQQCCSKQCTVNIRKRTMMDRYGGETTFQVPDLLEKVKQTNIARYGTDIAAKSDLIKKREADIFLNKYGVSTPFLMNDFQAKATATCSDRYGVEYTSQIPGRTEKMQQTNLEKYGSKYPLGNTEIAAKVRKYMYEKYGVPYFCMTQKCREATRTVISSPNLEFQSKLEGASIVSNTEYHINRFSYDLVVPSLNLLIEIDPTYTHNVIGNHWGPGIDKYYHQYKSKLAEAHGFRCIHVFDWIDTDEVVKWILSFDKLKFSEIHEPELHFSKETKVIQVVDPEDQHRLIEAGWLPVYDAGQSISLQ